MKRNSPLILALLASLTLGLAPFLPEPHLFEKVRWVIGGAEGMEAMDWFDLAMHGAPFVWLFVEIIRLFFRRSKRAEHA